MTSVLIIELHADSLRPLTGMRMDGILTCPFQPFHTHLQITLSLSVSICLFLNQLLSASLPSLSLYLPLSICQNTSAH